MKHNDCNLESKKRSTPPMIASIIGALLVALLGILACSNARADDDTNNADGTSNSKELFASGVFASRAFTSEAGKPQTYACFIRHYDKAHLANHPKQKVSDMKLLVWSDAIPPQVTTIYSFVLGVKFRQDPINYTSGGACISPQLLAKDDAAQISCQVDCDGGGIDVAVSAKNATAIVKLANSINIWQPNVKNTDDGPDAGKSAFKSGADDGMFILDRTSIEHCHSIVRDRQQWAEILQKK